VHPAGDGGAPRPPRPPRRTEVATGRPTPSHHPYRLELALCLLLGVLLLVPLVSGPTDLALHAVVVWSTTAVPPALPLLVKLLALGTGSQEANVAGRRRPAGSSCFRIAPMSHRSGRVCLALVSSRCPISIWVPSRTP